MDLIEVLQQILQNGITELKLTDLVMGTVATVSPLTIQIDTLMQPLPEEALREWLTMMICTNFTKKTKICLNA